MSFECARMCVEDAHLIDRIKKMNPRTLDWSNLSDYCSKEDFLEMAKGVSVGTFRWKRGKKMVMLPYK